MRHPFETNPPVCGPSGWSNPGWDRDVFPHPKPKGFHALEYMAQRFDLIEIGQSFQQPLRPELAKLWLRKVSVNPRFRFTAKLQKLFTHERSLTRESVERFRSGIDPLASAGKLGCVLMQFPWSFRFTAENRDFLVKLRRTFHDYPLVAEMRHASWMMDEAVGTFIDYKIGFCNIDQPEYTKAMPATSFLTSAVGYVRLHGRSCARWYESGEASKRGRYDYDYSTTELQEWKQRIERISRCAAATFVVFNNDAKGNSVRNALELKRMLAMPSSSADLPRRAAQNALFTTWDQAVA